jgi:hypothetical protein
LLSPSSAWRSSNVTASRRARFTPARCRTRLRLASPNTTFWPGSDRIRCNIEICPASRASATSEAAVLAGEPAVVRQLLEGDSGRRHADHATHDGGGLPTDAKRAGDDRNDQHGKRDQHASGTEHRGARRSTWAARTRAHHKHQQHDPELGQELRAPARREQSETLRADREAGQQTADDG